MATNQRTQKLRGRKAGEPKIQKTDYSEIARYYDEVRPSHVDHWVANIIEYGGISSDCSVLDVGCGTGRYTLGMSSATGCTVYGLDPSVEMLKQAAGKDQTKRILWIRGDGHRLPFRNNSVDCAYMTLAIHHMENRRMALDEVRRVLRKGGKCVIVTNSHSRIRNHVLRDFPGIVAIDLKRFPSIPSLKETMEIAGFEDVHHHILRQDRGYVSTEEYLERVRNRYISTLTLLSEDEFQRGLKTFEARIKTKYGSRMHQLDKFILVVGRKPSHEF